MPPRATSPGTSRRSCSTSMTPSPRDGMMAKVLHSKAHAWKYLRSGLHLARPNWTRSPARFPSWPRREGVGVVRFGQIWLGRFGQDDWHASRRVGFLNGMTQERPAVTEKCRSVCSMTDIGHATLHLCLGRLVTRRPFWLDCLAPAAAPALAAAPSHAARFAPSTAPPAPR